MDFVQFARAHGILINTIPPLGKWMRFPTEDHPKKMNGAVKFLGDVGFVQNHAIDTEVNVWRSTSDKIDRKEIQRQVSIFNQKIKEDQYKAACKADQLLKECISGTHPYLKSKGFEEEEGNIHLDTKALIIPMRIKSGNIYTLAGCQLIFEDGSKKFLYGQRTSNAEFIFDNKGVDILCEGYATALSVRAALKQLKRKYRIHVCFSAHNMVKIASQLKSGVVIADNDVSKTGEKIAIQIGWPYFISPTIGQDFNDYWREVGGFKAGQSLIKSLSI